MTAKQVYEATSIELNKLQAPNLKLYEFNYLFNKAIYQYINKTYNFYDVSQQTTDDLRVLKSTAYLKPELINAGSQISNTHHSSIKNKLRKAWYEVEMPADYLHMLNCVCIYELKEDKYCYDAGDYVEIPATRLTSDSWGQILTDVYNRPTPMNPYYYIHNVNTSDLLPTNLLDDQNNGTDQYRKVELMTPEEVLKKHIENIKNGGSGILPPPATTLLKKNGETFTAATDDINDLDIVASYNASKTPIDNIIAKNTKTVSHTYPTTIKIGNAEISTINKPEMLRYGNASKVRCEIRYGNDNTVFELAEVQVDYIKVPQHIRLTQQQLDLTTDTSQIMEFPDYVNQEIINELVHLVMEKSNDPRLGNHIQMTQTIARPTQQQPQTN